MSNLTSQQIEQLENLNLLPDDQIDTSDIPEITDWTGAVRGKFYQSNMIQLDGDVAAHFKDSAAVNHALRLLIQLAGQEVNRKVEMTDKAA
jgi:hypothetical protein